MSNASTPDRTVSREIDLTGEGDGPQRCPAGGEVVESTTAPTGELDPRQPAAMALGLAASDQRRDVAVGLLVQLVTGEDGVLDEAAAALEDGDKAPDPGTRRRALELLAAAAEVARTAAGPAPGVDLDELLDKAALFDSPSDYRAGVLDAVDALDLRDDERDRR